jgi:hypothetical protein
MAANINFICDCCGEKILESRMYQGKAENEYHNYNKTFYDDGFGKIRLSANIKVATSQVHSCICEKCALLFVKDKVDKKLREIEDEIRINGNES